MCKCRFDCVERPMRAGFETIGHFVGRHSWWFLVTPLLISAAFGTGFIYLKQMEANDIEDQFTPVNGPAKNERRFIMDNFPQNDSAFSNLRQYSDGQYASFIAVATSNILTENAFEQIIQLDKNVQELKTMSLDGQLTYSNLCMKQNDKCVSNAILDIINNNASNIGDTKLTFPFYRLNSQNIFLGSQVGGVKVNSSQLESATAIRLSYYLTENNRSQNFLWLNAFITMLSNVTTSELQQLSVSYFSSLSRQEEFEKSSDSVIPLFSVTYFLAIAFSILSCLRFDCVRNKFWVATFGVLSAGLAVLSSFGLLLFCGVPFAMTVATSPFLILGIGVDDMFIMISCWQRTDVHSSVASRLADTYKEAAISITITTLTDVVAFFIGIMTPFRSVQSFCLYTGTAVLFCYVYNITFFGAFLALNGRREGSNRHWITCKTVPRECPSGRSNLYKLCCVGGAYDEDTNTEKPQPMNDFFKKYYGPFLTHKWTKVFVGFLYVLYLAVSIYGCFQIQEGIELRNLASDDSYVVNYYEDENKYFSEYGPNVMVVVKDSSFAYWNETEREKLDMCIQDFKGLSFVDNDLFTSWLEEYKSYANQTNINLNNETTFKTNLTYFLKRAPMFEEDVNINNSEIVASRFFIQTINIKSSVDEKNMLNQMRETANKCSVPMLVYNAAFIYYDQYAAIVSNTIQNVLVATVVMLIISLLLIPSPVCSLWVTFAIASVIVGVAGFMALWDVNLDSISMINLIICIGFSVDFSAHVSYAFVSSDKQSVNEKATDALFTHGYPIVQGALSTILGVVVLSAAKSYIFRTFFKIVFLVILFGVIHGIIFIPVFLTLGYGAGELKTRCCSK